jgi:hypothetical protein
LDLPQWDDELFGWVSGSVGNDEDESNRKNRKEKYRGIFGA